jgi:predicted phage-related endonuclease
LSQVNVVLKQLEVLIDSQNQEAAKRRHHEIETKLRRTMMTLTMGALTNCFDAWREFYNERKSTKTLLTKVRSPSV